ncbi:MAG: hypothetical protein HZC47_11310 [Methanobacterium sp.]|uniref:hypothetical protein n=1 Tax=Methanobacterium sp. TaxID=2164 RepID=UPI003D65448E|nr:hypothetical protein [Methanobacterium sp.]
MENKQADLILYVLGFVGLLLLLGGIWFYDFKYGLVAALIIWFAAGAFRKYYGISNN